MKISPLATTALIFLVGLFPSLTHAYVRHNPQSTYNNPAALSGNPYADSRTLNAFALSQQNFSELIWPRSGEVTSNWGKLRPSQQDMLDGMVPQPIDALTRQNLANMASNNNYFFQKQQQQQHQLNNLNFNHQLMLAQAQSMTNHNRLAVDRVARNGGPWSADHRQQQQQPGKLFVQSSKRSMKNLDIDDDSEVDPDDADDEEQERQPSIKRASVSTNNNNNINNNNINNHNIINSKNKNKKANIGSAIGNRIPVPAPMAATPTATATTTTGADLQAAAGHHHKKHHGHGHYHQYAEVPKKKAWKFGYKRGNHKHTSKL